LRGVCLQIFSQSSSFLQLVFNFIFYSEYVKAVDCAWDKTCRYQQALVRLEREMGGETEECWADQVGCRDEVKRIERRCRLFRLQNGSVERGGKS
jgi:hypothetical protein